MEGQTVKAAILLSGSGRSLENFLTKKAAGKLEVDISAVVSSRPDVRGVEIAAAHGIPCGVFRRKDFDSIPAHNAAINAWLEPHRPRIIILGGYLCFYIQPDWFSGPVVNIHPALLPKYGGKGYFGDRVHRAVLAAGDSQSGCTVHLVDEQYDHGRILGQKTVTVLPGDDVAALAARVFAAECELYPQIVSRLAAELG